MPYGEKYMLNFIDNYSHMAWIYPLKWKLDSLSVFQQWKSLVEKECDLHVKVFCMDNRVNTLPILSNSTYVMRGFNIKPQRPTHLLKMAKQNTCIVPS